jgi:hypothetical protein
VGAIVPALGLVISVLTFAPAATRAATSPVQGVTVHPAAEVLANYVTWNGSQAIFHAPDGDWPLVTDATQFSAGDGGFHPMPQAEVESALKGVSFPLDGITAEVFILPYPRRDVVASSASPGCLVLSPGVREYGREEVHFVVTHELGHVVQFVLMPDGDATDWARYRALRGISDAQTYSAGAEHANRPHEIFAEDFRFLFGDEAARYTGGIENTSLELPSARPAVRAFFTGLGRPATASLEQSAVLSNGPNPFIGRTVITFQVTSGAAILTSSASPASDAAQAAAQTPVRVRLAVYGADGRMVRQLIDGTYLPGQYRVAFDGRTGAGTQLPPGIWFARLEAGNSVAVRKLLLAR